MKKKIWTKMVVLSVIIVAILVIDLVTKYVFDATLGNESVTVIPYLINFKMVRNYGAAWGILAGKQVFLIVLSLVYMGIFAYYFISTFIRDHGEKKSYLWLLTVACGLIFAGGIGNLYDRIFFVYVRDFIQFDFWKDFPVFNFADVSLCIGLVVFVVYLILIIVNEKKKAMIKIGLVAENEEKIDKKIEKKSKKSTKNVKNDEKSEHLEEKEEND